MCGPVPLQPIYPLQHRLEALSAASYQFLSDGLVVYQSPNSSAAPGDASDLPDLPGIPLTLRSLVVAMNDAFVCSTMLLLLRFHRGTAMIILFDTIRFSGSTCIYRASWQRHVTGSRPRSALVALPGR